MLKRKIYNQLLAWKQNSNGKTALLIDGARRVGKSYIADLFARQEYISHIIIDFCLSGLLPRKEQKKHSLYCVWR